MFSWFRQISVARRLRALVLASVLCVLGVACALLWVSYQHQLADRQRAVQHTVEVAHGILQWAHDGQLSGRLSQQAAQQEAKAALARLRYGGSEYFWVNDMHPRVVLHPIKPELDGRDVSQMADPNGLRLFQAFVDTVKQHGAGFVPYQWPRPGAVDPVDKVSYVKGFAPWGWIVGSGLYIDDLQAAFHAQMAWTLGGALVLAAGLAVLGERTARDLARGVREAVSRAEAIAQGDIAQGQAPHPLASGRDEIAHLLKAMQAMSAGLDHTVSQVHEAVNNVALASAQIAAGNTDLSARTEQAAARLQHTAASMEELTSTVQHNSSSSGSAQHQAAAASEQAQRGGEVVAEVVSTMEAIHTSARKITEIITVIDGIAFQTNILALNAAVEAARAGEQGRGFAVVAGEVRTLAQRSAQAAREIKSLIQASTQQVENGARLVHDAGERMHSIVGSVAAVNDLIQEIAHATREQSQGVGTVHEAVSELDQMTQQNAALVEESAAAAGSLHEQARHLAEVVGRFRLSGRPG
jgi:methyl-accepting chemotaxis protein